MSSGRWRPVSVRFKNKYFCARRGERKIGPSDFEGARGCLSPRYPPTHDGNGYPVADFVSPATISANRFTPADRGKSVSFRVARSYLDIVGRWRAKNPAKVQRDRYFSNQLLSRPHFPLVWAAIRFLRTSSRI
jgi:hypothetical protein